MTTFTCSREGNLINYLVPGVGNLNIFFRKCQNAQPSSPALTLPPNGLNIDRCIVSAHPHFPLFAIWAQKDWARSLYRGGRSKTTYQHGNWAIFGKDTSLDDLYYNKITYRSHILWQRPLRHDRGNEKFALTFQTSSLSRTCFLCLQSKISDIQWSLR